MANASEFGYRQLSPESVSATTSTPSVQLGARQFQGGLDYIYVYNGSSNQAIAPNRGVKIASGSSGYTVDVAIAAPSTVSAGILFGVCVNASIATGSYGWIAQRGFCQIDNFGATSIAAGDSLYLWTSGTFSMVTAATGGYGRSVTVGYATEAQATTTTGSFTAYIFSPMA